MLSSSVVPAASSRLIIEPAKDAFNPGDWMTYVPDVF